MRLGAGWDCGSEKNKVLGNAALLLLLLLLLLRRQNDDGGYYTDVHLHGTVIKYRSMALVNRALYNGGWMMVGASLPTTMGKLFPTRSICFKMSY